MRGQRGRIDAWPCDHDHPKLRHLRLGLGIGSDRSSQQVPTDAGPAHRHDADLLVVGVPEIGSNRSGVGDVRRVEAGDVPHEVEVLLGPVPDPRQSGSKGVGYDVAGIAHKQRAITQPWEAGDLLDHLRVVVGRQHRLAIAAVRHREPADEVGQPDVRRPLELGVLVQEVVELPGLVPDPGVIGLVLDQVGEHHEVVDEDLVHLADGLERVQVVLRGLRLDVGRLVGEIPRRRVDPLTSALQQLGQRVLGEPVDLDVRMQPAQLVGDGDVATRMAEADRGRQEQHPPLAIERSGPAPRDRLSRAEIADEVTDRVVDDDRLSRLREMPGAVEQQQAPAGQLGDPLAADERLAAVLDTVDRQDRATHAA